MYVLPIEHVILVEARVVYYRVQILVRLATQFRFECAQCHVRPRRVRIKLIVQELRVSGTR